MTMYKDVNDADVHPLPDFIRQVQGGETIVFESENGAVARLTAIDRYIDGATVGAGTGWLLADMNLNLRTKNEKRPTLPNGFASPQESGADVVLDEWKRGGFESGILWLHQTSQSAVFAVPTGRWDGSGRYEFFLWRGFGPVLELPTWSDLGRRWSNSAGAFEAVREEALEFGNLALGVGRGITRHAL